MNETSHLPPPPERNGRSTVRTLVEMGVSAVPVVGGPAQVFLTDLLPSALDRRHEEWIHQLGSTLNDLIERVDELTIDQLAEDESFVTAVVTASRIALGTHLEAKIDLLKHALQHVALGDENDDFLTNRFLQFIDELSPEHFIVMGYVADPKAALSGGQLKQPTIVSEGSNGASTKGDLGFGADVIRILLRDLADRDLLSVDLKSGTLGEPVWSATITDLGHRVLRFVEAL